MLKIIYKSLCLLCFVTEFLKSRKALLRSLTFDNFRYGNPSLFGVHLWSELLHAFLHLFLLVLGPSSLLGGRLLLLLLSDILLDLLLSFLLDFLSKFFFIDFSLSLGFNISSLLLLNLLGLLNHLLLVVGLHEVGNHLPSVNCARWEFCDSLCEHSNFFSCPFFGNLRHLCQTSLFLSLSTLNLF